MFARPGLCGMGIGRLGLVAASRNAFSPLSLFAAGERGVWYDPSDLSTLFQDSAGTTPVTAAGQPVGRMLDKSGRGNHATQSTDANRPTLQIDAGGRYYMACDGSNDGMVTSAVNFSATDKVTLFAGTRKVSNAVSGVLVELGSSSFNNFWLAVPGNSSNSDIFAAAGSLAQNVRANNSAPFSAVYTCAADISGASISGRVNGAAMPTIAGTSLGTGTFSNSQIFLFRRGGTTLPFNGNFYGLILRGASSTADQITNAERWLAAKTGVTL